MFCLLPLANTKRYQHGKSELKILSSDQRRELRVNVPGAPRSFSVKPQKGILGPRFMIDNVDIDPTVLHKLAV